MPLSGHRSSHFPRSPSAVPLNYTVSGLDAPDSPTSGLIVNTSAPPATFTLNDPGDGPSSTTFSFFTIDPGASGSLFPPTGISAIITFSDPAVPPVQFDGTFNNTFPITSQLVTAPDRTFLVELLINQVQLPPISVETYATVNVRVTQRSSTTTASVPDTGSTAAFLGLGLLAVAFARKRLLPTGKCHSIN